MKAGLLKGKELLDKARWVWLQTLMINRVAPDTRIAPSLSPIKCLGDPGMKYGRLDAQIPREIMLYEENNRYIQTGLIEPGGNSKVVILSKSYMVYAEIKIIEDHSKIDKYSRMNYVAVFDIINYDGRLLIVCLRDCRLIITIEEELIEGGGSDSEIKPL